MTEFAQYPYAMLQSVGSKLTTISDDLGAKDKAAANVDGLSGDQSEISSAIGHFRSEWDESVRKLGENIGTFGDLSAQIGEMVANTDDGLAQAMRPGGDGGGTGGTGGGHRGYGPQ